MLIILDLDGTLVDSEKCHFNSFVKSLERNGFAVTKKIKSGIMNVFGLSAKDIIKKVIPGISEEKLLLVAEDIKEIAVNEEIDKVKIINGAMDFVKAHYKSDDLAIITNSSEKFTRAILKRLDLMKYFKMLVAPGMKGLKPKPSDEMINHALNKLRYNKSDCLLIGDSIYDFLSAKKAKIRFIAVLSKSDYKKELKKLAECYTDLSRVKI